MSFLSSLNKKLAMKKTLKMPFGRRPFTILSKKSKGTGLRLVYARFEKDPMRNGRVIQV